MRKSPKKPQKQAAPELSRTRKPDHLSLEDWQRELRVAYGKAQKFKWANEGTHPFFSAFRVTNPASKRAYCVTVRAKAQGGLGDCACTCPDFAVNTLGTCKHLAFVLHRLGRKAGFKAALKAGHTPEESSVYLRHGSEARIVCATGSACPPALAKKVKAVFAADAGALPPGCEGALAGLLAAAQKNGHPITLDPVAARHLARVRDAAHLRDAVERAHPHGLRPGDESSFLKETLHPWQREGVLFLAKTGRAILADDMGLGKTIQAIGAAELLLRHAPARRVLVVCPTSLRQQWQEEITRFTRRAVADAVRIEGGPIARKAAWAAPATWKITSYESLVRDLEQARGWEPDLVILDEAQKIKNWLTRCAATVKRLESPFAFVLTGTPLENRLEEIHSLVEFVDRNRLGPLFRLLDKHQTRDADGAMTGYRDLDRLHETLKPILLRRTKAQVLPQMPKRTDERVFVELSESQRNLHEENGEAVARLISKWRKMGFLRQEEQLFLQACLAKMRMACDSSFLLDGATRDGEKTPAAMKAIRTALETPGAKVVVFSQWLRMLQLVEEKLSAAGIGFVQFNGGVPGKKRGALVKRFREDPQCRVFLSTDAGGVGLNLQFANHAVIMDQPWNPAVLEQRIGRVYRLGQKNPVQVTHLVAKKSIEENMLTVLANKRALAGGVLDGTVASLEMKGSAFKRFMESVESTMPAAGGTAPDAHIAPTAPTTAKAPSIQPSPAAQAGADFFTGLKALRPDQPFHLEADAAGTLSLRIPLDDAAVLRALSEALAKMAAG